MDIQKATQIINLITKDEDLRQDLWVAYLSGIPLHKLPTTILQQYIINDINSQDAKIYQLAKLDIPIKSFNILNNHEKYTLLLLYLGYNIGEISVTLGKSRVAILELIASIKQNKMWDILHGTEKIIH
jgi:hypothetical protein